MLWQRWLMIILLLCAVTAAVLYGFLPQPVLVETATAERGLLQVTLTAEGKTRVKDRYVISAPVAGIARRIVLNVGDPVSQGQIVAWLEPLLSQVLDPRSRAEAQAQLAAATAQLRVAQEQAQAATAAADYTRADHARLQRLRQTGVVSQEVLDQSATEARRNEARERSAQSTVEVAHYQLEAARSALRFSAARDAISDEPIEQVTLKSPVNGQVLAVHQRSAFVVEPGRTLLEVGDPRQLEIEIEVLSADAVRIAQGGHVLFDRWGGAGKLEGQVHTIEPVAYTKISALGVEEQRVRVIADFTSPRPLWERLGDGYRVEATFILWENDEVLQIPTAALLRHKGNNTDWAVYVVEGGITDLHPISIGQRAGLRVEIIQGLTEGMQVIVHPSDAVSHGIPVKPI
jgi:HlyD family secretion protein